MHRNENKKGFNILSPNNNDKFSITYEGDGNGNNFSQSFTHYSFSNEDNNRNDNISNNRGNNNKAIKIVKNIFENNIQFNIKTKNTIKKLRNFKNTFLLILAFLTLISILILIIIIINKSKKTCKEKCKKDKICIEKCNCLTGCGDDNMCKKQCSISCENNCNNDTKCENECKCKKQCNKNNTCYEECTCDKNCNGNISCINNCLCDKIYNNDLIYSNEYSCPNICGNNNTCYNELKCKQICFDNYSCINECMCNIDCGDNINCMNECLCNKDCHRNNNCFEKCICIKGCDGNYTCINDCNTNLIVSKYSYMFNKRKNIMLNDKIQLFYDIQSKINQISYNSDIINYNFTLYINQTSIENISFYLFIENSTILKNEKEEINNNYTIDDKDIPFVFFTLSNDGEIKNELYNNKINNIHINSLKKIIREISYNFKFQENNTINFENEGTESILGNNSILFTNSNVTLDKYGKIIYLKKNNSFNLNNSREIMDIERDNDSPIQSDDLISNDNKRNGIINDYKIETELEIRYISEKEDLDRIKEIEKLLSIIEFDSYENITKENEYENKNQNDNRILNIFNENNHQLRNLEVASLFTPVQFNYFLFKLPLNSGDVIGLGASIGFFPMNSTVAIKLIFKQNEKEKMIYELYDNNNNYNNIAEELRNMYLKIAVIFGKSASELSINSDKLKNQISTNITEIIKNIKNIYGINELFKIGLDDLYKISTKNIINGFNNSINQTNIIYNYLSNLSSQINNNNNNKFIIIKNNSNQAIANLINLLKNNLLEVNSITNKFYDDIMDDIKSKNETNSEIILDIETFYLIKELLDDIEYVFVKFKDYYKSFITNTTINYTNYKNKEFDNIIEKGLSKNELIAHETYINPILIDNYSEEIRNNFRNKVKSFRNTIYNIFETILDSIKKIFNDSNNQLNDLYDNYYSNKYFQDFKNKKDKIISELERIIKVNTNFTIYTNDLKVLNEIERELQEKKIISFNNIFVTSIDNINFDYLTKEIMRKFENDINNQVKEAIISFNNSIDSEESLRNIENINKDFIQKLFEEIKNKYVNITFINETLDTIYNELDKIGQKYETIFYKEHFEKNIKEYTSIPYEIPFKLQLIFEKGLKERNLIFQQIKNLIQKYINYTYNELYPKIEEINIYQKNILVNKLVNSNWEKEEMKKQFIDKMNSVFDVFNRTNILNQYYGKLKTQEETDIKTIINNYENKILYSIYQILDSVKLKFDHKFCLYYYHNICIYDDIPDKQTIYNYQIAKIRSSISDFKNLLKYSECIVNENNLNTFDIQEYFNDFKEKVDFKPNDVFTKIIEHLNDIHKNETELYYYYLNLTQTIIIDAFNSNININKIISNFEYLSQFIFNIPNIYLIKKNDIVWMIENEIKRIYVNKIEDYMNYEKYHGFFFKEDQFIKSYKIFYDKIINIYDKIKENINNLELKEDIINQIISYEEEIINKGYNTIKNYLNEIDKISLKIELLNNTFSISEFDISEIDNLYNEIKQNIKIEIKQICKNKFNNLIKEVIINWLNYSQKRILERLNDEKGTLETYLFTHSQTIDTDNQTLIINNMSDYENSLINTFQYFYNNFSLLFSNENLKEILLQNINDYKNEFEIEYSFDDFSKNLTELLGEFVDLTSMIYYTERKQFSKNFSNIIEKAFIEGIKNYNEFYGFNYYDAVVEQDFFNIYPQVFYINQVIDDTREYSILLFNASKFENISEFINKTLSTIYIDAKEIIKINTKNKMNVIYNKLNKSTEQLGDLIIEYFFQDIFNHLKGEEFKNMGKIYNLIPKEFSSSFIQKLQNHYYELTNNIIIKDIQNNFKEKLDVELKNIYDNLDETQEITNDILANFSYFKNDETMKNILLFYNEYNNNIKKYKFLKIDENNDNKIKENLIILMNEINNELIKVSEFYFSKIEETKNEINKEIDKNSDFKSNFIKNLNAENKIKNTVNAYEKINSIKENVISIFTNIFKNLTNINEKEKGIENRRLAEFNIDNINGLLEELEKAYDEFSNKIKGIKELFDLSNENNKFSSKILKDISDISSHINSIYTYLRYIYPNSKLDDYFLNIENNIEDIKILFLQFLRNETLIIEKTTNLINNNLTQIYKNMRNKLKNKITDSLAQSIPPILKKLKKINQENNSESENITIISKYEYENELLSKLYGMIKDIKYLSNFSFDYDLENKLITFNGTINVTANGVFNTEIDFIKEKLEGSFIDSELGLNINYSLYDKRAYIKAYVKQNNATYNSFLEIKEGFSDIFPFFNNITIEKILFPVNIVIEKKI